LQIFEFLGRYRYPKFNLQTLFPQIFLFKHATLHTVIYQLIYMFSPGLNDAGPLDDDNGEEEARLTRVLQHLPVVVRPLLTVRIPQIVDSPRLPGSPQEQQPTRPESVLRHDDKIGEKSARRLDA
jgi:hypothetical protein